MTVCRGQCKGALGITARKLLTMHHICSWEFVETPGLHVVSLVQVACVSCMYDKAVLCSALLLEFCCNLLVCVCVSSLFHHFSGTQFLAYLGRSATVGTRGGLKLADLACAKIYWLCTPDKHIEPED